jgi:hypothetical protein
MPLAPTQSNGKRRKHHHDRDDDQNAIERHLTSPWLMEELVACLSRERLEMDQNQIADHAAAS